jgi:hypothetical protein
VTSLIVQTDVTDLFETYRECARHVRNTYFSTRKSQDWDTIESFDEVAEPLFAHLVLGQLADRATADAVAQNCFLMIPSSSVRMPLMISRDRPAAGSWDHPITFLEPGDATIAFREYFDWDEHALIDFRYYRGIILASQRYPDIIEHEVLIETIYARVLYEPRPVT